MPNVGKGIWGSWESGGKVEKEKISKDIKWNSQ